MENRISISDKDAQALARLFLPYMLDYFDSEEGQQAFAKWQKERENGGDGDEQTQPDSK